MYFILLYFSCMSWEWRVERTRWMESWLLRRMNCHTAVLHGNTRHFAHLSVWLLRHVRRDWALLSFHSVCLSGCLSVVPRPTAYHDWSITTKFGRQVHVYTCPRTRVSLFGSPIFHTFGARGKICKISPITRILATANVTHRATWLVVLLFTIWSLLYHL